MLFSRWVCFLVCNKFSPTWKEGQVSISPASNKKRISTFSQNNKTRKIHDQGHRLPFFTPSIGSWYEETKDGSSARWQEVRSEMTFCLQTDCQKCHGYNWKTSIAINGNTVLAWLLKKNKTKQKFSHGEGKRKKLGRIEWSFSLSLFPPRFWLHSLFFSFLSAPLPAHHCKFFFIQWKENHWFVQEHLPGS